jgi:hypothetical protein
LHDQAFSTFPALMHDVHTRIRLELLPCRTRTRWMLGTQRRLDRLWEKLTCLPTHGSLPQTSQRYGMRGVTSWEGASDRVRGTGGRCGESGRGSSVAEPPNASTRADAPPGLLGPRR